MTLKALPTLGVVGAFTGCVLKEQGFGEIHEVFDHFYPGIMQLGMLSVNAQTKEHLGTVVPALKELPDPANGNWRETARVALERFGETIELDGPLKNVDPLKLELETLDEMAPGKPVVIVQT